MIIDATGNIGQEPEIIFGQFWQITTEKISIHHDGLISFIADGGFFWVDENNEPRLMRQKSNIIKESNINEIVAYVFAFINCIEPDYIGHGNHVKDLRNVFVRGIVNYINLPKLRLLPTRVLKFHRDAKRSCFFYFKNCVVEVTEESVTMPKYEELDGWVWKKQIKPHNFTFLTFDAKPGQYETFTYRLCNQDKVRHMSLMTIIGYMLHRYFIPSINLIPCLLEETIVSSEDIASGGSGKGILFQGFKYIRNLVVIDGKKFNPKDQFAYQLVEKDTEIIIYDDLARNVSFEAFFSILSNGLPVNKKGRQEYVIPLEQGLKHLITSNYIIKSVPGFSTDRRKIEFEAGTYYGKDKTVAEDFNCQFYTEWSEDEYNKMFNFFVRCVQLYMREGLVKPPPVNTELRKMIGIVTQDLKDFLDDKFASHPKKITKQSLYMEFLKVNPGQRDFFRSQNRFTNKVRVYLDYANIKCHETPAATKKTMEFTYPDIPSGEGDEITKDISPPLTTGVVCQNTLEKKYVLIDTVEKRSQLVAHLAQQKSFCFDLETTGLDPVQNEIVSIGFSYKANEAYFVPIPENKQEAMSILGEFSCVLENDAIEKVGSNLKFDIKFLALNDVTVKGQLMDTCVAHYLSDSEDKQHGLKYLSGVYLGVEQTKFDELFEGKEDYSQIRLVPQEKLLYYACQDVDYNFQLKPFLEKELQEKDLANLYYTIEAPLIYALSEMELNGVKIDKELLLSIKLELEEENKALLDQLMTTAGDAFNPNSPIQLEELLVNKLGIEHPGDTTKTGNMSFSTDVLEKMNNIHPIVSSIIKYKQNNTLVANTITPILNTMNAVTNMIHPDYNNARVVSGRLSCKNPNVQGIPKSKKEDPIQIRRIFIPRAPGRKILAFDYSQMQMRIICHFSLDKNLIEVFNLGSDIHTATASKMFKVPVEQVSKENRNAAKAVNFGIVFGLTSFGLAKKLNISEDEAATFIDDYMDTFPGVRDWIEQTKEATKESEYTVTIEGRRRYLRNLYSDDRSESNRDDNNCINAPVQGSEADITKKAINSIYRKLKELKLDTKMILAIHDELVFDAPENEIDTIIALVQHEMENAVKLIVPLTVEYNVGNNWQEAK